MHTFGTRQPFYGAGRQLENKPIDEREFTDRFGADAGQGLRVKRRVAVPLDNDLHQSMRPFFCQLQKLRLDR